YTGSYDSNTPSHAFRIGPGVAPLSDIYSVRVFGCQGSTDVVNEAIDWAVANHMQVINLSLGSSFGDEESSDAVASTNAEEAGVIVVASAGNSGAIPYIVGAPSTANKTISVAAIDSHQTLPGASLALSDGSNIDVQLNNNASIPSGSMTEIVIPDAAGEPAGIQGVGLGCLDSDYSSVTGKLVVVARGTCARIY